MTQQQTLWLIAGAIALLALVAWRRRPAGVIGPPIAADPRYWLGPPVTEEFSPGPDDPPFGDVSK